MRALLPPALLLSISGCVLEPTFCGEGFVEEAGRCVPATDPPPYYADGVVAPILRDARVDLGAFPDAGPVDARPVVPPPPDRWSDRFSALLVDRGSRGQARSTPVTPGYDLDAVVFFGADAERLGALGSVIEARINDPFNRGAATEPRAALGDPDARSGGDFRRFVSLGTEGGFLFAGLEISRPLRAGDRVVIYDQGDDGAEPVELFICRGEVPDLDRCLSVGEAEGTAELRLE